MLNHLNIELTNKCNQSCFYCSNPARDSNELTVDEWLSIIQGRCATSVLLTGGEPFLYSGFVTLLDKLHSAEIETSILSNGGMPKTIDQNRDVFKHLRVAQISLDSTDPSVHDRRRGFDGAYEKAIKTLSLFKKLSVLTEISMVVDTETVSGIQAMINYCEEIGVKLVLRPLAKLGRSVDCFKTNDSLESLAKANQDVIIPDQFGYGAPSISCALSEQLTLSAVGK